MRTENGQRITDVVARVCAYNSGSTFEVEFIGVYDEPGNDYIKRYRHVTTASRMPRTYTGHNGTVTYLEDIYSTILTILHNE